MWDQLAAILTSLFSLDQLRELFDLVFSWLFK